MVRLLAAEKLREGSLSAAVAEAYFDKDAPADAETRAAAGKLGVELRREARALDWDQRRTLIAPAVDVFLDGISYLDRIKMASSAWDLLWFALALGAAWKIAEPS